jgi:hypothetical protein
MSDRWSIGEDGWPLDPRHREERCSLEEQREQFFVRELLSLKRAWVNHRHGKTLIEAVTWCHRYSKPPPDWLVAGVVQTLAAHRNGPAGKKERKFERDCTHWDAVRELRDRREELKRNYKTTWDAAYSNVAKLLYGDDGEKNARP